MIESFVAGSSTIAAKSSILALRRVNLIWPAETQKEAADSVVTARLRLRMELDRVPLWRGDHVSIKQIVEDFARYLYLPRVSDSTVLLNAIRDGIALLTWEQDAYAFADSFDDAAKRYRGLRGGRVISLPDADATTCHLRDAVALNFTGHDLLDRLEMFVLEFHRTRLCVRNRKSSPRL